MLDSSMEDMGAEEPPQVSPDLLMIPSKIKFKNEEERQAMMMSISSSKNQHQLNQANIVSA